MEVNEILKELGYNNGKFARRAVEAAIENREEVIPHLLRIVEDTIEQAATLADEPEYMAHIYALHLLAQFREPRAYSLTARLFSIPGDVIDKLAEDFLPESLGPVLASVAHGDVSHIKALVENPGAYVWARVGALRAIPVMVGAQELSREAALSYFRELLCEKLDREPFEKVTDLWDAAVYISIDLHPEEIYDAIKRAYKRGVVNSGFVALEDVDRGLARGKEETLRELSTRYPLMTDTIAEMHWWACFKDDRKEWEQQREQVAPKGASGRSSTRKESPSASWPQATPGSFAHGLAQGARLGQESVPILQRGSPKVGRNDPCPCGSGKKHKKCCGAKELA